MLTGAAAGALAAARPDPGGGGGAAAARGTNLYSGGFCSESISCRFVLNETSPTPSFFRVIRYGPWKTFTCVKTPFLSVFVRYFWTMWPL